METAEQLLSELKEILQAEKIGISKNIFEIGERLASCLKLETQETKKLVATAIYSNIEGEIYRKIWLYSLVNKIYPRPEWMKEWLETILESEDLLWQTLYFLYEQITAETFINSNLDTKENLYLRWKVLDKAYWGCRHKIGIPLNRIPIQDRNPNFAVVLVEQFLTVEHGPTKTVLDRCYTLKKVMGKQVLMINTSEMLSKVGESIYLKPMFGAYLPEHLEDTTQSWKGEEISYFQCENDMPNLQTMELLLQTIMQLKPQIVICVGGSSMFAGLVNELVPVLTVGTTTSGIVPTLADYQVVNKQFIAENEDIIRRVDRTTTHMIEGNFTFSLKPQTEFITRQELDIPNNAFVIGVIGGRLDFEISEELISLFEKIVSEDVVIFLIGTYNDYENCMENHPSLKKYVHYKGYTEDILSRIELCDLYLNPLRKGGGTSAVEAMYKGKPVVTISYGDVAGIVGDSFCCADYIEMEQQVRRYITDVNYYDSQARKAKEISEKYLDSEREFKRIIEEYLTREND